MKKLLLLFFISFPVFPASDILCTFWKGNGNRVYHKFVDIIGMKYNKKRDHYRVAVKLIEAKGIDLPKAFWAKRFICDRVK